MITKILFVFHEDTRTGAPNALLSFLNYINENHQKEFIIDIFVLRSIASEIEPDLKKIARNFYTKRKDKKIKTKIINIFKPISLQLFALQKAHNYDIVYGNTILTLKYLSKLKQQCKTVKTILHVHEGNYLTSLFLNKNRATKEFQNIDHVITVTQTASNNLEQNYGVIASKIAIISPAIEQNEYSEIDSNLLKEYSNNDLILVNLGQPSLTKGTDLIPQIANYLRAKNPNLKFKILIIGITSDNDFVKALKLDIDKLELNSYIELISHTKTPLAYLNISNACLITSREESFSLVGVQAVMLNKPLVLFKNAIGLSEIVTEQATYTANYLDTYDFADKILELYNFPETLHQKTSLSKQIYTEKLAPSICNKKHYLKLKDFVNQIE